VAIMILCGGIYLFKLKNIISDRLLEEKTFASRGSVFFISADPGFFGKKNNSDLNYDKKNISLMLNV
jgi:hypothetical protein